MKVKRERLGRTVRGLGRNVVLLGVVSLLADVSSEMIQPVLPIFLVSVLGASYVIVGLIEGLAESLANLLKVTTGWYSDRMRRRRPFILFGYSPAAVMKPLLALATSWPQVLGIRAVERAGKGVRTAPRDALIAESAPPGRRGAAFGLHRAMDSAGAIIGTVISLLLVLFALRSDDAETMRILFVLSAIPAAASVLVVLLFVKERRSQERLPEPPRESFMASLRGLDPRLKRFLMVVTLIGFANAGYAFFVLRAESAPINASLADILVLYIALNVTYTICSIPAGVVSDRTGRRPLIAVGLVVFAVAALVMGLAESLLMALCGFLLYGVFLAMGEVNQRALASELALAGRRGTSLGAYHTVLGLTALPAGVLFGALWDLFGAMAAFAFGASVALVAVFLMLTVVKEDGGTDSRALSAS